MSHHSKLYLLGWTVRIPVQPSRVYIRPWETAFWQTSKVAVFVVQPAYCTSFNESIVHTIVHLKFIRELGPVGLVRYKVHSPLQGKYRAVPFQKSHPILHPKLTNYFFILF